MLFAHEAHLKTNEIRNKRFENELKEIEEQINDAIQAGQFSVTRDGCIHSIIKEELERHGYKVKTGNQYNEYYHIVSWN